MIVWNQASILTAARRIPPPPPVGSAAALGSSARPLFVEPTTTNDDLDAVINALERGQVQRAYIVSAVGIETLIRATPEACVGFAPNKIEYELTTKRSLHLASLLRELKANSIVDSRGADVRVGLVLSSGPITKWRWSVFTDEFGQYGYMGGHSVKTNAALVTFVNRALAGLE